MSKSLFEEAIADAKLLRETAEQNAKNAIIEAVTPRIREFIENQLVGNGHADENSDFLMGGLSEDDSSDQDDGQSTEEVELDESALRTLAKLMGGRNAAPSRRDSDFEALSEAFDTLSEEERKKIIGLIREEESDEKSNASETDDAYEINLDELKAAIKSEMKSTDRKNGANAMKKHEMQYEEDDSLYELDEMMGDEDLPDIEEAVKLKMFGSAQDREMYDALGLGDKFEFVEEPEEGESDEDVEVGPPEEEAAEAAPEEESGEDMKETVYEIDESMLRRELARLREAKSGKKSKSSSSTSHKVAAASFGGGTLEGDALDTEMNELDLAKKKIMKEARENRALKQQLNDYRGAVETLREQLSDLNLFNAKLLYVNKILQNKDVAPNQRRAIIEALDGASNLREAKLLYESLSTSITTKNHSLNESVKHTAGLASRPVTSSAARIGGAGEVDRWAILAGIK